MLPSDATKAFDRLRTYVESTDFRGWDPYDALLSPFPFKWTGKWGEVLAIQAFKRFPLNPRPLFAVPKAQNPKALGLFLESYTLLHQAGDPDALNVCHKIFEQIMNQRSNGYSGSCWGYNFPWSGPAKQLPAYFPSSVVTAVVARGLDRYFQASGNEDANTLLLSIPGFILHDLHTFEDHSGISYSYTPDQLDICYNASLFAAETLCRCDAVDGKTLFIKDVKKAVDFVISRQKPDGAWMYSETTNGSERKQIDFHQGYILDSISHIKSIYGIEDKTWNEAIEKGARFYYEKQFTPSGRSLRRLPRKWPADIHAQAQGIITFSLLKDLEKDYLDFAGRILQWTLKNMYSQRRGYFYYQKYPFYTIKTPYMRWAQAWMMLAMANYRAAVKG